MLLQVWTNFSVCSDNTFKKFKGITKVSAFVTSKHNTGQEIQFWKKRLSNKTLFTLVLTMAGGMAKTKEKNPDKMYQLLFLKIYTQQQKQ